MSWAPLQTQAALHLPKLLHRDTQLSLSPHLTLPTLETKAHQQLGSFLTLS